jgi:hypothetical protein
VFCNYYHIIKALIVCNEILNKVNCCAINVVHFGVRKVRLVLEVIDMTGKRFLTFLAHRGIPASCFAQRLGCNISSIKKLQSCDKVPRHYINMLVKEFGGYLTGRDLERLTDT